MVFDPIEQEVGILQQAQELGIDRAEFHRRESLVLKFCPDLSTPQGDACWKNVMTTGKAPKAAATPRGSSAPDLSDLGVPAR